jgi:aryl-alcohol dehydrogenase-like predicted oxidoreductase
MISRMEFGRTGHDSTRILFGAAAIGWGVTQSDVDKTLETLFKYDINHIDTAASYGDAELRIGPWMKRYRKQFFLATKTEERTRSGARESIEKSLERLQTDQVDLIQIHNLSQQDEWDVALGPGGALEAMIEARQQGLVRFIGVTGHGTQIAGLHLKAIDRFEFDSVLLPYNYAMMQNQNYAADFYKLVETCRERKIAVQTIKGVTRAGWGDKPHTRNTWYEPLEEQADIDLAVHYVLGNPSFFLNTAGDVHILPRILDAASRFENAPSEEQMAEFAQRAGLQPLFV